MKDALIVSALSVVPKGYTARLMGRFARTRLPAVARRALLRWYVAKYGVNLEEAAGSLDEFPTLVDFFTRALRPGVRPIDPSPDAVVSPVDGLCYAAGVVTGGRLPQAPSIDYAVADLLGGDTRFEGGAYAVLYLSPRDYHRVHAPCAGVVRRYEYLPGALWPVFPAATQRIRDLFARNERLVTWLDGAFGEVAVVMVGAFGVGRMRTVYADIVTNAGGPAARVDLPEPWPVRAGDELGRFEMGSTVILVFPPGRVRWDVEAGQSVRYGLRIGTRR